MQILCPRIHTEFAILLPEGLFENDIHFQNQARFAGKSLTRQRRTHRNPAPVKAQGFYLSNNHPRLARQSHSES
jgi:hypothetical protein